MEVLNKQTYTTTILDISIDGEEFQVTHSEDFDDVFVPEYIITDGNGDEVDREGPAFVQIVQEVSDYMNYTVNAFRLN